MVAEQIGVVPLPHWLAAVQATQAPFDLHCGSSGLMASHSPGLAQPRHMLVLVSHTGLAFAVVHCEVMVHSTQAPLGAHTVPVYEIYKVGADAHWLPGLDVLGELTLPAAVVPHWNNRSGVRARCPDCHVPHDFTDKVARKMQASREVLGLSLIHI